MSKALVEMKRWLSVSIMRSVEVNNHAHGFRVTLKEWDEDMCTYVGDTFEEGFEGALALEPEARDRKILRDIERETATIKKWRGELREKVRALKVLKETFAGRKSVKE